MSAFKGWGYRVVPQFSIGTWCILESDLSVKILSFAVNFEMHLWYTVEDENGVVHAWVNPSDLRPDPVKNGPLWRTITDKCPCCGHEKEAL